MSNRYFHLTRRTFLLATGALTAAAALAPRQLLSAERTPITRAIPSSGELLPIMGMGTSETFDVGEDQAERRRLAEVMRVFFDNGGTLIDSSPMYGRAEAVVGELLKDIGKVDAVFAATKVWTDGRQNGIDQMNRSMQLMGVKVMDLMQIHNLLDWRTHLPVLREWKKEGRFRYLGITTSHGRFHEELEELMAKEPLDFVQFTYNLKDRAVEERLLPLAADRGIATIVNRPFQRADMFAKVEGKALPEWASEFGCRNWGQFFLKFIAGHPSVTCIIPATSKVHHMRDNMEAGFGPLPDAPMRKRMATYFASL